MAADERASAPEKAEIQRGGSRALCPYSLDNLLLTESYRVKYTIVDGSAMMRVGDRPDHSERIPSLRMILVNASIVPVKCPGFLYQVLSEGIVANACRLRSEVPCPLPLQ